MSLLNLIHDKLSSTSVSIIVTNKFIYSLLILLSVLVIAKVLHFILSRYIKWLVRKTKTTVDDEILDITKRPIFYLIILLGIYWALIPLNIPETILAKINNIIFSIIVLVVTYMIIAIVDILITSWGKVLASKTRSNVDDDLLPLLHKTSKVVFFIFGLLYILHIWGINVTGFLAGLGIAGIAIGFAVKDSLANIFGGISLILDKAVKVGDRIKLESGVLGEIEDIGLRSTKLKTFDNEILVIPNGSLANQVIQNYTLPNKKLRIKVFFGVEYGNNVDKVIDVVQKALSKESLISSDPSPEVLFIEMSDSSLNFQANIWVDNYKDAYKAKILSTKVIYNSLNKAKIGIPFPTRTVYLKKE